MANGLNMRVLLQLQTKQFQQGVNAVKKSLGVLKNSFMQIAGALGAGLGMNALLSSFKEVSTQLSSVQTTLKNVSNGFGEYADNMQFLHKIAKTYGQDLIALTEGFAQFRAAAKNTNLDLEQQRDIYEAMTQAAGAFQLSTDQTRNAMLAVTQMLSKGKVASEELRRQLGNTLPGAFNMMAKAAQMAGITTNGTTAELEEAMKKGRVLAEDVLPAFAQVLKTTTSNANFDTIQSSLNRLKNSWYEFVNNSNFTNFYKGLLNASSSALDKIGANFTSFKTTAIAALTAVLGGAGFKKLVAAGDAVTKNMETKLVSLRAKYKQVDSDLQNIGSWADKKYGTADQFGLYSVKEKTFINGIETSTVRIVGENEKLADIAKRRNELTKQELSLRTEIDSLHSKTVKNLNGAQKALRGIGGMFKGILASLAGYAVFTAILFAITKIVTSVSEWYKEQKRINSIVSDTMKEVNRTSDATVAQISKVRTLQKALEKVGMTEKQREGYIKQLNRELGLAKDKQLTVKSTSEEIATAIGKWEDRIKKAARAAAVFGKIQELTAKNLSLEERAAEIRRDENYNKTTTVTTPGAVGKGYTSVDVLTGKARKLNRELKDAEKEIQENNKAIDRLIAKATVEHLDDPFGDGGNGGSGGDEGGDSKDKLKKALDDYKKTVNELNNQLKRGAITEEEYNKELSNATEKTFKAVAAFDNLEEHLKTLGEEYQNLVRQLAEDFSLNTMLGKLDDLVQEATDEVIKKYDDEFEKALDKANDYQKKINDAIFTTEPTKGKRSTFSDYKKTNAEVYGEQADIAENYASDLSGFAEAIAKVKEEFGTLDPYAQAVLDKVLDKLKEAGKSAKNLRDKANASQWIEDVKKLKKELADTKFDAFKSVAESMDRLVRASRNLADAWATLSDNELDEQTEEFFNKLNAGLSILNEGIQLFETMKAVVMAFQKVEEARTAFQKAASSEEAINTAKRVGLLGAEAAAETSSAAATVAAEGAKKTAIEGTTQAAATNAVVGAASSVASIPVVGWVMAGAAIAGMIAAIAAAMSKKFAGGGIVNYGSYSGDNTLARVNRGEMILNGNQQRNLFSMLNGGGGVGGNVEFRIKGSDLVGAIKNYNTFKNG